jgi:hypothetical protein
MARDGSRSGPGRIGPSGPFQTTKFSV